MKDPSNPVRRAALWLRGEAARHGRSIRHQMIRGMAFGLGSGIVSLLVFWIQIRH
ncbi:hypothetical protein [Streptomyces sp. JNUCC 63]